MVKFFSFSETDEANEQLIDGIFSSRYVRLEERFVRVSGHKQKQRKVKTSYIYSACTKSSIS